MHTEVADLHQAPAGDRTSSPFRLDLTGTWKCKHVSRAADRDQNSTRVWAWSGS